MHVLTRDVLAGPIRREREAEQSGIMVRTHLVVIFH